MIPVYPAKNRAAVDGPWYVLMPVDGEPGTFRLIESWMSQAKAEKAATILRNHAFDNGIDEKFCVAHQAQCRMLP